MTPAETIYQATSPNCDGNMKFLFRLYLVFSVFWGYCLTLTVGGTDKLKLPKSNLKLLLALILFFANVYTSFALTLDSVPLQIGCSLTHLLTALLNHLGLVGLSACLLLLLLLLFV